MAEINNPEKKKKKVLKMLISESLKICPSNTKSKKLQRNMKMKIYMAILLKPFNSIKPISQILIF